MIEVVDTHCHIHSPDYELNADNVIRTAEADGVTRLLCVGTTYEDSKEAIDFVRQREHCWATIGLHPHESAVYARDEMTLGHFASLVAEPKVVAVGETGLDFYYNHSTKEDQIKILKFQLDLAHRHQLPLILHIRDAFEDFWPIFDLFPKLKGVVHSFSATTKEMEQVLRRGLYVGLNGIMTFTKDEKQLEAAKMVPLGKLLLETDAPFLTPVPFRGKICEPKHVRVTAEFLADLRGESLEKLAAATTHNAVKLFGI